MPVVLIVGGHGKVAMHITKQLVRAQDAAYSVHSIIRDGAQSGAVEAVGAVPIVQDIEACTVAELVGILERVRPDAVVWAAGARYGSAPDRVDGVDHHGAVKVMDALSVAASAAHAGRRLVSISALDLRDRQHRPVPAWYDDDDRRRSDAVWAAIGLFMRAKFQADRELRTGNEKRALHYTMVRPGGLTDQPAQGRVNAGKVHLGTTVSREDVAAVVVESIKNPSTIGLAFDLVGGQRPVAEAVEEVGNARVDTFEGYY